MSTLTSISLLRERGQHLPSSSSSFARSRSGVLASSSSSSSSSRARGEIKARFCEQNASSNAERFSFKTQMSSFSKHLSASRAHKRAQRDVSVSARWRFWRKTTKEEENSPWWLMDEKAMKRFTDEGKEDVFRLRTTNLPGMSDDKMTPEGAAAGALVLGLAVWAFVIVFKLLALVWGIMYAGVKYSAIAAVLVLLGIAAL